MSLLANRKRSAVKPPEIKFASTMSWDKGVRTDLDADRISPDSLRIMENVQLSQNGTVGPRPGLKLYGAQPANPVIGRIFEYVRINANVPETWLIWMENDGGTGKIYTAKDGDAGTLVTGKTYDVTGYPTYEQVAGKVLIANGVDNLSYMDVQFQTIFAMNALTQPVTAPTPVATGITGTNITLRYRYSAANLGETSASLTGTVGTSRLRETWNGTGEYVTITGNRIAGAERYNLYVGTEAGSEYFLDTITDPGSGTTWTYIDTGAIASASTRIAPEGDSTAGPKVSRATNIKGQPFMVGDKDNPGRVWFGGTGENALDLSSYNGGGWVEPNKGGKDFPVKIVPFRDGKGTPMANCLSKGTNGNGKRYLLSPQTTTVGTTVISYMSVQEDNGQDGTDSPDGVILKNDSIFYPSRTGFKSSKTLPQIQNLISTIGISGNIKDDVASLSPTAMAKCIGLAHDDVLYWSLPFNADTNNQIWMVDLRQKGAWIRPWYVAAEEMILYADNADGMTKFLMLVDNKIYEVDKAASTNDDGVAFQTNVGSGDVKFNEDGTMWANVIDVTFTFLAPQGDINMAVSVTTEDGIQSFSDTMPGGSNLTASGWGRFGWGASGWGQRTANEVTVTSSTPKRTWKIEVDEECNTLNWNINTISPSSKYQLSEVIIRYVPVGFKETDNV